MRRSGRAPVRAPADPGIGAALRAGEWARAVAVFEYRGILIGSGKPTKGVRDAENPKVLRAGIPLFESLNALIDQVEKPGLKRALTNVREQVREGQSFAKALESHPTIFAPLYINMVRAGEASGTLEAVLERLTAFMEGQAKLKGKVTAALAYPILMLILGTVLISVLMIAVVPRRLRKT